MAISHPPRFLAADEIGMKGRKSSNEHFFINADSNSNFFYIFVALMLRISRECQMEKIYNILKNIFHYFYNHFVILIITSNVLGWFSNRKYNIICLVLIITRAVRFVAEMFTLAWNLKIPTGYLLYSHKHNFAIKRYVRQVFPVGRSWSHLKFVLLFRL